MRHPLLKTKLILPPPAPHWVARPRLLARLDAGLHPACRLILVCAPAGFGKTSVLTDWIRQRGMTAAWLSLEEADDDPARFLTYLIGALQSMAPEIGEGVVEALDSPQPPPVEEVLTAVINQMADRGDPKERAAPFVLVLDDYHLIHNTDVHRAVSFLLEHAPASMHLTLATRADPPLPVARLRAQGRMVEIRQADLAFTSAEARAFLAQALEADLAPETLAALTARMEGWPAGLQMAAVSMRGRSDPAAFVAALSGTQRFIVDYLGEEVLNRQSPRVREFLLQTSILDRLCGPLCDAVTDEDADGEGDALLGRLSRANLFIEPLDETGTWYRYHRLFRDLLRQRLAQSAPDRVDGLHRRAAAWYEAQIAPAAEPQDAVGAVRAAVEHTRAGAGAEAVASLLDAHADVLWLAGSHAWLFETLADLPADALRAHPRALVYRALGQVLAGRFEGAERALRRAEAGLDGVQDEDARAALSGVIAAHRSYAAFARGETGDAQRWAERALGLLPSDHHAWRGAAAMSLGDAHIARGDLVAATGAYEEALEANRAAHNAINMLIVGLKLADTRMRRGFLHGAMESCRWQMDLARTHGLAETPRAAAIQAVRGDVLREWNRLDEAAQALEPAVAWAARGTHRVAQTWVHLAWIGLRFSRRDWEGMEAAIADVARMGRAADLPVWVGSRLTAWTLRMQVVRGRKDAAFLQRAARLAEERGLSDTEPTPAYLREEAYLALARLRIAQERGDAALGLLDRLRRAAEAGGRGRARIEIAVLRALALDGRGERGAALRALRRALREAEPEGFVRLFVDEGPPMARLLYAAADAAIVPGYVGSLLAAFPVERPDEAAAPPAERASNLALVEPLTPRELEVLAVVATGATNQEVARDLTISVNTVKKHMSHILAKLEVDNRREASRRGRSLGLVD